MFVFFKRKIKLLEIILLFVVIIGLYFLTYDSQTVLNIGDLITLITAFSLAWHLILSGRYVKKTEVMSLVGYQFLFAAIFSFLIYITTQPISFGLANNEIYALLYLGFIGTLVCYFISVWVQKYVDTVTVALIFTLEPVFATLFAWAFASEKLILKEILGGLIILSGIVAFQLISNKRKKTNLQQ